MTFQFKIQLKNLKSPPVWRRILVPAQFSFHRFHLVIQEAFGWGNYHLFQFSPKGFGSDPVIQDPFDGGEYEEFINATKAKLNKIFNEKGQVFTYIYDFGDGWEHKITLEKILGDKTSKADCLAGNGTCPPEDCGGPWGYINLMEILKDPKSPERGEMKEWLGLEEDEEWNADQFDLEDVRDMVRLV